MKEKRTFKQALVATYIFPRTFVNSSCQTQIHRLFSYELALDRKHTMVAVQHDFKSEIRSTNLETISNHQNSNPKQSALLPFETLGIWTFGFRYSIFGFEPGCLVIGDHPLLSVNSLMVDQGKRGLRQKSRYISTSCIDMIGFSSYYLYAVRQSDNRRHPWKEN